MFFMRRHMPWLTAFLVGLIFIGIGLFFISKGTEVRNEILNELQDEQIITSKDSSIPNILVSDAKTAKAQSEVIKEHTLGKWGPYSQMDREDPNRDTYLKGVTLRTALNLSVAGLGITDMAIGAGILILIAGGAIIILGTPSVYYVAGLVVKKPERTKL